MKVAVIGTGNMGTGFANLLASADHDVAIGARDPAKAAALAEQVGNGAVGGGIAAAVKLSDVIVLALPYGAIGDALKLAGDLSGKVLVDISNPVTADFQGLVVGHTTSAAEEIQALAPLTKVVKGFNTIFAQLLPREGRNGKTLQVFLAGDDEGAKDTVSTLATSLAFEPIDCGPLSNSRFIEPIGAMNIQFGYFLGWGPAGAPSWVRV
jgi:NADPH-dependent F420 reductase